MTIDEKRQEYKKYVMEHTKNILICLALNGKKIREAIDITDEEWAEVRRNCHIHDRSKLSNDEFEGYRQYFYPVDDEERNEDIFKKAWLHHIRSNPHHWEYWIVPKANGNEVIDMPNVYIMEMVIDWTAMSYHYLDDPQSFYDRNSDKILLHPETRIKVKKIINAIMSNVDDRRNDV